MELILKHVHIFLQKKMLIFLFFGFTFSVMYINEGFSEYNCNKSEENILINSNDLSLFVNFYSDSEILYDMVVSDEGAHVSYVNDSSKTSFFVEGQKITIVPKSNFHVSYWALPEDICKSTGIFFTTSEIISFDLEVTTQSSKNHHDPICFFSPPYKSNQFTLSAIPSSKGTLYEAAEFGNSPPKSFTGSINEKTSSQSFIVVQPTEKSSHVEITLQFTGSKLDNKYKMPHNSCDVSILENISPESNKFTISYPGGNPSNIRCGDDVKNEHTPVIFIIVIVALVFVVIVVGITIFVFIMHKKQRDDEGYLIEKQDDSLELSKIVDSARDHTVSPVNLADIPKFL